MTCELLLPTNYPINTRINSRINTRIDQPSPNHCNSSIINHMPAPHSLLSVRTHSDSEKTAESAAQLFATLPQLRNRLWHRLLKKDERLSVEI